MIQPNKLVLFGAGKIGRSFIAQLFSRAGYETVFIDIEPRIIRELNRRSSYPVYIRDEKPETIQVTNFRGVFAGDEEQCIQEIAGAGILATAVGKTAVRNILPLIARGLLNRHKNFCRKSLDIIIAENMHNADKYFSRELQKLLPEDYPLKELAGLVETSIGKMVPLIPEKVSARDPLAVYAEAYNSLIVDAKAFRGDIPEVPGLEPKENMKAWVDRKIFLHNFGHAATAYLGNLKFPEARFIAEVLIDKELREEVFTAMEESARILMHLYPEEFSSEALQDHTSELIERFANPYLEDTLFRVGCDLKRKLGPDDRIMIPLRTGQKNALPYEKILKVLVAGYHFRSQKFVPGSFPEDEQIFCTFAEDPEKALAAYSGLDPSKDKDLIQKALQINESITDQPSTRKSNGHKKRN